MPLIFFFVIPINALFYIFAAAQNVRLAHSDIPMPDFTDYRRDGTKNPTASSEPSAASGRVFTYVLGGGKFLCGKVLGHLNCIPYLS